MRHAARVLTVGFTVAATGLIGAWPTQAAASSGASRFTRAPAGLHVTGTPLGLSQTPQTYVVQLAGDPVTVADAAAAAPLSASQKTSRRASLRQAQTPVEAAVRTFGGTVLAHYEEAYNGVKVRIAPSRVSSITALPGVVGVHRLALQTPDNIHGVPLIGAPQVWDGLNGLHGEGIKIGIIDTGIDYTHADFGGPGTSDAYAAAHAGETTPANPAYFGLGAPKVKGGIDLVGDTYNADPTDANYQPVPHPDSNPLDCNGHGTHVAGTAAGFGVTSDGSTYPGPYDAGTVSGHSWNVGPGVAPKADLYAIRVFGCEGSTDVTIDAIEWAVDNGMDVINMSLGSPWGSNDDPSAVAANNAAKDGIIVVASSGNQGHNPYMSGSPSTGSNVISVAASDPLASNPGATLSLSTGPSTTVIDANGATIPNGTTLPVVVLRNPDTSMSQGCDPQEYMDAHVTGKLVIVVRGTCARVARAIFGQQAGAAAVLMVNTSDALPPYEGSITSNPDTGEQYTVTIPFLGAKSSDKANLLAADGGTATLAPTDITNPAYLANADFSSAGPRTGDSALKPDVTAPGVSIFSAGIGTGNGVAVLSGTSMAAPHTAGMAALVRQAHPTWNKVAYWKDAIVNTADPSKVAGYLTRISGAGLIQAPGATRTDVVASGDAGTATLSYGFAELNGDYSRTKTIQLRNFGSTVARFSVSSALTSGSPHTTSLSPSVVTVQPHKTATVNVTLHVPASSAGTSAAFADVAGLVTLTPTMGTNHGVTLRVPYYLVPQATSKIRVNLNATRLGTQGSATGTVRNATGVVTGTADWYAWGLSDPAEASLGSNDVRAVGVQAFPGVIAFGISTAKRWSNPAANEFDVYVDVNGDSTDDYVVVSADLGGLTTGDVTGQAAVAVFDLRTGEGSIQFLTDAPFDSSTLVMPVLIDQLCASGSPCLSAGNPRFTYHAVAFDITNGAVDTVNGTASFNAFSPSISTGMFDVVSRGATATETVSIDKPEFALTPARGVMVISHDNRSADETTLIPVTVH